MKTFPLPGPLPLGRGSVLVLALISGCTCQKQTPAVDAGLPMAALDAKSDPAFHYFQALMVAKRAADQLADAGVAVDANRAYDELYQVYEENRYRPLLISSEEVEDQGDFVIRRNFLTSVPSVVTVDVVLHHFHLFFDFALAKTETETMRAATQTVLDSALSKSLEQRKTLQSPWVEAAADNLVFIEVARVLLASGQSVEVPEHDSSELGTDSAEELEALRAVLKTAVIDSRLDEGTRARVRTELDRVIAASGTMPSTLFDPPTGFEEDYSQFTPRGHYVKTPALTSYFLAVMWLSRVPLYFSSDKALRSTVLLARATADQPARKKWDAVHEMVGFLAGPADDITFEQVRPVVEKEQDFAVLRTALTALKPPQVQSTRRRANEGPSLDSQKAFHFFSQRAVIDAVLLQGLVDPQIPGKKRIRALEVPATLGSSLAAAELTREGFGAGFSGYLEKREALHREAEKALQERASHEVAAGWLSAIAPLISAPGAGAPPFMQGRAYETLRLSTWLASYAELKHDTVLYAKQSAAEMGGPGFEDHEETIDDRGYVVPEVEVYARIGAVLKNLREGLKKRELFPDSLGESYGRFEKLTASLETISRKELEGKTLSASDYQLIKFIGGDLEHFWEETLVSHPANMMRFQLLMENNSRLIADLFTGPEGITHVASGYVHPVYVAFPRDGKVAIGRGAVMSFYEVDAKERLTDHAWREQLAGGNGPAMPTWTQPVFVFQADAGVDVFFDEGAE